MKAIMVDIYESKSIGNCSNNGISARFRNVLILHEDGWIDVDENNPPENLCKVVTRYLRGVEYKHLEPVARPTGCGWMSGGAVCYSCDSRFRDISDYPLCLHDRQESNELYYSMD